MIKLRCKRVPLGPWPEAEAVEWEPLATVYDYIPDDFRSISICDIRLNDKPQSNEEVMAVRPRPGDTISIAPVPGFVDLMVSFLLQAGIWAYNQDEAAKKWRAERLKGPSVDTARGDYSLDVDGVSIAESEPIPIIYGTYRTEGAVIQQYGSRTGEQDYLHTLLAISEGPISDINPNGASDLHINGNASTLYHSITIDEKLGTLDQTVMAEYESTVTTTAINVQLLQGGVWGGEASAYTCTGTITSTSAKIVINYPGGFYWFDTRTNSNTNNIAGVFKYRYRTDGGAWGAWSALVSVNSDCPRLEAWEYTIDISFASAGTHDVQIARVKADSTDPNAHEDSYVKEYQEIIGNRCRHPSLALLGVRAVPQSQLSGSSPKFSCLVKGRIIDQMTSASAVSAPAYGNNPADIFLDLIYNDRYGYSSIDKRVKVTLSAVSGAFTVGETVLGPASDYQFRGKVYSASGNDMVITCQRGLPYTSLTGQTSSETATVDSIDESYAVDLTAMWEWHQFCDEYVPDGTGDGSAVDANSASGQKVLNVTATTDFTAGDYVIIDPDGDREETGQIDTIQAGISITLLTNLTYTHTQAQADDVLVAEKRCTFNGPICRRENGMDVYERLCKTSRTMPLMKGQKFRPRPYKAETPVAVFSEGSIVRGSLRLEMNGTATRPNIFDIQIYDEDHNYLPRTMSIEDALAYTNLEDLVRSEIDLIGCTSPSQATREGNFLLKRARYCGNLINFKAGRQALNLEVGDVFHFEHVSVGYGNRGGRVVSSTASTVTLDRPVTLGAGTYTITVQHADDTIETQTITSAAGTHVTLSIAAATWTANPAHNDVYGVGTLGRYRIVDYRPNGLNAEIVSEEDSTAYYVDNPLIVPTWTENSIIDVNEIPPDVENVTAGIGTPVIAGNGPPQYTIDVCWTKPEHNTYSKAEIFMKHLSAQLMTAGSAQNIKSSSNGEFNLPMGGCIIGEYVYVADSGNHRIVKLTRALIYSANIGSYGTGNAQFNTPTDLATDGTYLFVCDSGNHRIQVLNAAGAYQSEIGGVGSGDGQFQNPWAICCDGTSVWVADSYNHRVQKLTIGVGGALTYSSKYGSQGSGDTQFERPLGIAVTGDYLYIADTGNNRIKKHAKSDYTYTAKIGSTGTGDDNFKTPIGIEADTTSGYVWVTDTWNHRFHRRLISDLSLDGMIGTAGTTGIGVYEFNQPGGCWYDSTSLFVFISERENHRVRARMGTENTASNSWLYQGWSAGSSFPITSNIQAGARYEIAVCATSATGAHEDPEDAPSVTITATRRSAVPPDVTGFIAANSGANVLLRWDSVQISDLRYYSIHQGVTYDFMSNSVATTTETRVLVAAPPAGTTVTYHVKAVTWTGEVSATEASVTYTHPGQIPTWPPISTWNWRS